MTGDLRNLPRDIRRRAAEAIRARGQELAGDVVAVLSPDPGREPGSWRSVAQLLLDLLAMAVDEGELEGRNAAMRGLSAIAPPFTLREIVNAVQRTERTVLDELSLDSRLGATSEVWPIVAHAIRGGSMEIVAAYAERDAGQSSLRDPLTTLLTRPVFDIVLAQEIDRAYRHRHGFAIILFDIDDLSLLNRTHGYGAGDRLLERLGILGLQFFRTHDWVARHGGDSIVVLLPETTLDQAATLAQRFREMVHQRLVLVDHKTDIVKAVTVSASAVGTELVHVPVDGGSVIEEAEAAVVRARMNGGNRIESVALLPTSVTITGAATLLGVSARSVVRLLRGGSLAAARRGRHFHIERALIEEHKRGREGPAAI